MWAVGFFFFFQAEDGIRDYKVTGVQTCALPICTATCTGVSPRLEARCQVALSWTTPVSVRLKSVRTGWAVIRAPHEFSDSCHRATSASVSVQDFFACPI